VSPDAGEPGSEEGAATLPVSRSDRSPVVEDGEATHRSLVRSFFAWSAPRHVTDLPETGQLLHIHRERHPRADPKVLERAYRVADHAHRGQMRRSGDPYITHPLAVATILAELGMDTTTCAAALLHDTVEDTAYTLDQLRVDFGQDVAHLVDGVTKLDKVRFGGTAETETMRKMILAAGQDVRVLIIKLADRLHNMRTLGFKSRPSQVRIANATRDVLVPLAGRLGLHILKRPLEDLVLATLEPEAYACINEQVRARAPARSNYLAAVIAGVALDLQKNRIRVTIDERERHYHSIYKRMREGRLADNPRIQIVVTGEPTDCYEALGVVHGRWHPVPGRFKDHIGVPKFNMYQSLHTTVVGPDRLLVDVMIRTAAMHRIAEYGVLAYRRSAGERPPPGVAYASGVDEMGWLQKLLQWEPDASAPAEFIEALRCDLSDHEVLVFTPKGLAVSLPARATPVDFAYAVDAALGDRCFGAKVNGRLTPLSSPLSDGDVVEVLTSPAAEAGPSKEWLEFVRSPRARIGIQRHFAERAPEELVAAGREAIATALKAEDRMLTNGAPLVRLARSLGLAGPDALFAAVGDDRLDAVEMVRRLIIIVDGPE
jgi:GTP diphosphokinase / guanosine-3',5'-bis(diphosphate) 3'-diphosphatase